MHFGTSRASDAKTIDLPTLDSVHQRDPTNFPIDAFRRESASLEVRLGVLHYLLCHNSSSKSDDLEAVVEFSVRLSHEKL